MAALLIPALATAQTSTPSTHTVRAGDTLWGLARQYLNDPLLWPEIYRLNTLVVEDPHWIYPGEVLQLSSNGPVASVPTADTPAPTATVSTSQAQGDAVSPDSGRADSAQAAQPSESEQAAAPAETQVTETQLNTTEPVGRETGNADLDVLFGPSRRSAPTGMAGLSPKAYHPIRRSEFYSSGFLSEGESMPFGELLGPVTPEQIRTVSDRAAINIFTKIAVMPPTGATYQVGDSVLIVRVDRNIEGWGKVIVPTGIARILDVSTKENTAEVIAEYGAIRIDQFTLPLEKYSNPGNVHAVPISDGVQGALIASRDPQDLKGPQDVVFIDKGKKDGVALGDIFEVRRTSSSSGDRQAATVPEVMATMQVVHVRERSATAVLLTVTSPDMSPGTNVRQIAKLPS
ncbi:MAG: LysM peptidoglycan-binding domain-containing protein [Gemmatimonadota bacterium]